MAAFPAKAEELRLFQGGEEVRGRQVQLQFEFPKLYRKRDLPEVEGLGKCGWQEAAEGPTAG